MRRIARLTQPTRTEATTPAIVEKELSFAIVKAFFYVYNRLGFGFLEHIYSRAMEIVLRRMGIVVTRELSLPVHFEGHRIGMHRLDMLVEGRVAVEIKAIERIADASHRQLRNYLGALRLNGQPISVGIILHFGPQPKFYRQLPSSAARAGLLPDSNNLNDSDDARDSNDSRDSRDSRDSSHSCHSRDSRDSRDSVGPDSRHSRDSVGPDSRHSRDSVGPDSRHSRHSVVPRESPADPPAPL
jgi:GxxExxY protein